MLADYYSRGDGEIALFKNKNSRKLIFSILNAHGPHLMRLNRPDACKFLQGCMSSNARFQL